MKSLVCVVLRWLLKILFRVRVQGVLENRAQNERLLIVANHESMLDGLLLGLFLPVPEPVFVVHTEVLKNPLFRLVLLLSDHLSVDPSNPMAMKQVIRILKSGRPVVIFPEGRLTRTGSLMKVYEGPAFVAAKTGAAVLPVRLDGPSRSYFSRLSGEQPRAFFPRIRLTLLPFRHIPMPEAPTAKLRRRKAGDALRQLMQEMIFASEPQKTLFASFCDALERHGRQRRVVEDIKRVEYRYQDLLKMILMLGRLTTRVAAPGERIGVLLPNLASTLCLILGMGAQKRVPALLNYTAGVEGMQAACKAAEIKTLITAHAFVEQMRLTDKLSALEATTGVRVLYLEEWLKNIRFSDKLWLMAFALWQPRKTEQPMTPEDPAVVLFTSGSEGAPKGVVLPHRAILANIAQIRASVPFSCQDKFLNALPIFHSFGLSAGALLPLLSGANLFLYPSPLHYRVIPELAYDRGCTVLFGASTFLGHYARFANPYDFYRLRYVIAGAEKLSESVRDLWFEKFGLRIFEGYGATETAPVLAVNTPMAYRSGTVGQFLPGVEHHLLPVPGIARGGLLQVRGPNVMSGYLKVDRPGVLQPPATDAGAGWYDTGDVVDIDADGFVQIVGRVKRFAKVAGEMVSLEAVENLARALSPEQRHAASSRPD
ncbi:MAG: AMP-binding protein, partial [Zoogloeaceae bacterium]|nr:AMP-binding protein [Zoogloeaceae bacterium]